MFEKNPSTTVKDMLIDMIASKEDYSRDIIEKVIRFQGEDLLKGMRTCDTVEISGLGVLYVAKTKLATRIRRVEAREQTEENIEILKYLKGRCRS
jgi:nucleoid DNA-binding protein